ncbi:hypothetical protein [Actinoplanes palleronii]|uniref:Uncharacterized protein n=1 Tax=Actinoplanes palleronii TaxID=113570 RepID=A0ABQ4BJ81_9ACTN|nr:hypothetical protein [Actinoplanes palleronii]GIE70728.1 hypothetical protein Apa02nite_068360 [Actinoplanes palleronii]
MSEDYMAKLAGAKGARRSVPICLRGDLQAQFEHLQRELEDAERAQLHGSGMEEAPAAVELSQQIQELREQMREATYDFVVQALPAPDFRALKAKYPPRTDDAGDIIDQDRFLDANVDDLLLPLFRASLVDPVLDDAAWAKTDAALSDGQYQQLLSAALGVNKGEVNIPFSPAALRRLASSGSE